MGKRKTIESYYLAENPTVFDHICEEIASYDGHEWSIPEDLTSLTALVGTEEVDKLTAITDSIACLSLAATWQANTTKTAILIQKKGFATHRILDESF
jgi:hypothetical protein